MLVQMDLYLYILILPHKTTIKVAFGKDGGYWYGDAIISSLEAKC